MSPNPQPDKMSEKHQKSESEHHQTGAHLIVIVQGGSTATKFLRLILPNRIYTQAKKPPNKKTGLQRLKCVKFAFSVLQDLGEAGI